MNLLAKQYIEGERKANDGANGAANPGKNMIGRLIKWLMVLAFLGFLTVLGYTFLGDFRAPEGEYREKVTLDVD